MSVEFPDAGPHATPDQIRAAQKRRDAARDRSAQPEQRHAPEAQTVTTKRAKKSA